MSLVGISGKITEFREKNKQHTFNRRCIIKQGKLKQGGLGLRLLGRQDWDDWLDDISSVEGMLFVLFLTFYDLVCGSNQAAIYCKNMGVVVFFWFFFR